MNTWTRSSKCATNACVEVQFHKSSKSEPWTDNCVEVGLCECGQVKVRDSKDPDGTVLSFSADEWDAFTAGVRNGEFD